MIGNNDLVTLLNKYGIDGEKLIKNNPNVLEYGEYDEIEKIIKFLKGKNILPKNIEKCPSILWMSSASNVEDVYNFLVNETELKHINVEDCLHILSSDVNSVRDIYYYVMDKYGLKTLINCPGILSGDYLNIINITKTLESTIGINIVKDDGGSILYKTTGEEIIDILTIPEFKYDKETQSYNKNLLTATTFQRTYDEIIDIFNLKYWQDKRFKPLLTPSVWRKDAEQIKDILDLSYWEDDKFKLLLTPSIWYKDAKQIKDILDLSYWEDDKFKPLLTSSIWLKDAEQIKDILDLDYWQDDKFKPLLTSSIWLKDAEQIKDILDLDYWKDDKFKPLLTPSIWLKDANKIKTNIEICKNNGLEEFANNPTLIFRLTSSELQAKINYLKYKGEPLFYKTKGGKLRINSIFGMSNANMKKKYGISKKELVRDYLVIKEEKRNVL